MEYAVGRSFYKAVHGLASDQPRNPCVRDSRAASDNSAQCVATFCLNYGMTINTGGKSRADCDHQRSIVDMRACVSLGHYGVNNDFRIELFDTEIDSIRTFDPLTQRSLENLAYTEIGPCSQLSRDDALFTRAGERIRRAYDRQIRKIEKAAADRLRE